MLNILIAGRDAVSPSPFTIRRAHSLTLLQLAVVLTITVYFLSQYPDVMKRLREEVLAKVGSARAPDYDDIRELKYLRAVLNGTSLSQSIGPPAHRRLSQRL